MIRHLLKLVWRRKRANALVIAEIFFSFLVVFLVATLAISLISRWRAPLGFDWQNVWIVTVDAAPPAEHSETHTAREVTGPPAGAAATAQEIDRLMREIAAFPQVEAVGAAAMPPYMNMTWGTKMTPNGRDVEVTRDRATDGFAAAMKLPLLTGRWFSREDNGQKYIPIVIDSDAAAAMFGTQNAVGRSFESFNGVPENDGMSMFKVVGVVAPYRKDGELSTPGIRMVFSRATVDNADEPETKQIVVRVRPGTPASFESDLSARLHAMSPTTSYRIRHMSDLRALSIRQAMVPVVALTIIALFLISMVALGLTGVLWQTVTRRMREIGLRRALGASGGGVRGQVLSEVALLATLAVVVGVIIVCQLPLLGAFRVVTPGEFSAGVAGALAVIYAITLLCGAYPSWLASTVEPAEALRYE